jgi:hypothetical protein
LEEVKFFKNLLQKRLHGKQRFFLLNLAMSHLEIKIVNKEGHTVPIDEPGELLVRGHNTLIGNSLVFECSESSIFLMLGG